MCWNNAFRVILIVSGIILSIATNGGGALITGGSANG